MNIGEQIAKYRKEKHLTQEQLGEAVGVTNRTVSKWEACVSSPGVDLIPSIASALGISLGELFGIEKQKETTDISETFSSNMTLEIADTVKRAINDAIEETLPDAIEDALAVQLPESISATQGNNVYSLLVLSKDKASTCPFYGIGRVQTLHLHPSNRWNIMVTKSGNRWVGTIGDYDSKEEAAYDLDRIFKAYSNGEAKIEL